MVDLTKLNAAQKQAVFHVDGPALVVAGAGTGKTAVISMRIAHLLLSEKIPAESILSPVNFLLILFSTSSLYGLLF